MMSDAQARVLRIPLVPDGAVGRPRVDRVHRRRRIGAVLDRNGLRPSRYLVTKDGLVVMASEAGVLDIPPEQVAAQRPLQPGRMFLIDTVEGRIVEDEEIKALDGGAASRIAQWLDENLVTTRPASRAADAPRDLELRDR